jgi:hypothetical protein
MAALGLNGALSAFPMRATARSFLEYLLAMLLVLGLASVACHHLVKSGYAGVSDEATVRTAISAYGPFLEGMVLRIAALVVIEALLVGVATSGLLALGRTPDARWRRVVLLLLAVVASSSFVGSVAHRYPGLFLSLVSAHWAGPLWLSAASVVWPALLAGSAAGWLRLIATRTERATGVFAVLGLVALSAWVWLFEIEGRSAAGNAKPAAAKAHTARPNVLLIAVDSLRPDKIDEKQTPVLWGLSRESIYFPNTLVTLPRTAPSWAALFTSMPPISNGVETMFPSARHADLSTLAMPAHLSSIGYSTMVSSEYAGECFGRMKLGFDRIDVPRVELQEMLGQGLLARHPAATALAGMLYTTGHSRALGAGMTDLIRGLVSFSRPAVLGADLIRFLSEASAKRPWFSVLFYSQPHFPYTSSSRYYERNTVTGADSALRFGKDVTRGEVRTAADRRQVDGLYRAALAETDAAIGDLLRTLRASGEIDDTIVVLTADHGEGLYECGACVGHGDNLVGTMSLRVPLAIRLPKARFPKSVPVTNTSYVSQLDVYPTLLSLLGVPVPPVQEGVPLVSRDGVIVGLPPATVFFAETGEWLWPTVAVPPDRVAYPPITEMAKLENERIVVDDRYMPVVRAAKHRAAIYPPYKLVYRPDRAGATYALFNIDTDPFDERDISRDHPEIAHYLKDALRRSVLRHASMIEVDGYFLTRPAPPPEEYY